MFVYRGSFPCKGHSSRWAGHLTAVVDAIGVRDVKYIAIIAVALVYGTIFGSVGVLDLAALDLTFFSWGVELELVVAQALLYGVRSESLGGVSQNRAVNNTLFLGAVESVAANARADWSFNSGCESLGILYLLAWNGAQLAVWINRATNNSWLACGYTSLTLTISISQFINKISQRILYTNAYIWACFCGGCVIS